MTTAADALQRELVDDRIEALERQIVELRGDIAELRKTHVAVACEAFADALERETTFVDVGEGRPSFDFAPEIPVAPTCGPGPYSDMR